MTKQVIALLVHVTLEDNKPVAYGVRSATEGITTEHSGSSYIRIIDPSRPDNERQIGTIGATSNITHPGCLVLTMGDLQNAKPISELPNFPLKDEFTGKKYGIVVDKSV